MKVQKYILTNDFKILFLCKFKKHYVRLFKTIESWNLAL